jgi:hypothetical protein
VGGLVGQPEGHSHWAPAWTNKTNVNGHMTKLLPVLARQESSAYSAVLYWGTPSPFKGSILNENRALARPKNSSSISETGGGPTLPSFGSAGQILTSIVPRERFPRCGSRRLTKTSSVWHRRERIRTYSYRPAFRKTEATQAIAQPDSMGKMGRSLTSTFANFLQAFLTPLQVCWILVKTTEAANCSYRLEPAARAFLIAK